MPTCLGWCGLCYANVRCRSNYRGHKGYRRPRAPYVCREWEKVLKKPSGSGSAASPVGVPGRGDALASLPLLWAHLTDSSWDDGTARQRSTLTVFCDGGLWKVCLNDREGGRSAFQSGETLEAALEATEHGLEADSLPWRAFTGAGKRK